MFTYFLISLTSILSSFLSLSEKEYQSPPVPMAMCHTPAPEGMAAFAHDPAFQALHEAPLPIQYTGMGTMIQFETKSGPKANAYLIKATSKSNKWLLVYQEWWGLNDYIKQQSDIFYKDLKGEVNVLAIDMYDGQVATDPKEAAKLLASAKEDRLQELMKGAANYAGKKAQLIQVGWCFGGSLSLKSAIANADQSIGCIMYYGMPVREASALAALPCDVLGIFATEERISKEIIEEFAGNMKAAGKTLEYKIFNAAHAFANPSNPKYDVAAAKEAYQMSIGYLKNKWGL
jgi:carboxymethylenebutenolidase